MTEVLSSRTVGSDGRGEDLFELLSPADGKRLAHVARATRADVDAAVAACGEAFETGRTVGTADRLAAMHRLADLIDTRAVELATELSQEQGKPITEAEGEIAFAAAGLRSCAEDYRRFTGSTVTTDDPTKRVWVIHQRRGTWAIVTPWNFPFNIPVEYIGPALATGSPFVWKPAPTTTRIASRLFDLILEAGVPLGAANLLVTDSVELTSTLLTHPGITCVGLTGSAATGRAVAQACWDKHLLLELGGNGPTVVLDDADMSRTAAAVAHAAFWNAGQVCSAAGRVLVHERVADELTERLATLASDIEVGPPSDRSVTMGPVHTEAVLQTATRHVEDAVHRGGRVVVGGARIGPAGGRFFAPTVLEVSSANATAMTEETFGPVVPVLRFSDQAELLREAVSGSLGLVSSVFTNRLDRAIHLAERMESGTVVINDTSNYWEARLPFGGRAGTASGQGRVGGNAVLSEFTQTKTVSVHVGLTEAVDPL